MCEKKNFKIVVKLSMQVEHWFLFCCFSCDLVFALNESLIWSNSNLRAGQLIRFTLNYPAITILCTAWRIVTKNIAKFPLLSFYLFTFLKHHLSWLDKGKIYNFYIQLIFLSVIKVECQRPHAQHHESLMPEGPNLLFLYVGLHEVNITD